jgi:3-deoxy-D-manno-octulosonic-acid transferase
LKNLSKIAYVLFLVALGLKINKLYMDYINQLDFNDIKVVIAPHNIKSRYIESLKSQIKSKSICFSELSNEKKISSYNVFILDTIGYLSRAYSYADIVYVGGAAGTTGLHNILEPAVFGSPNIIGKNYNKFPEADALIKLGGVTSVSTLTEFSSTINTLITDNSQRKKQGLINKNYIEKTKEQSSKYSITSVYHKVAQLINVENFVKVSHILLN